MEVNGFLVAGTSGEMALVLGREVVTFTTEGTRGIVDLEVPEGLAALGSGIRYVRVDFVEDSVSPTVDRARNLEASESALPFAFASRRDGVQLCASPNYRARERSFLHKNGLLPVGLARKRREHS